MFLTRVLPVEIKPVKVVLLQELDDAVDKLLTFGRVLGHGRVLGGALVPATDGDGDFQLRIGILEVGGLLETSQAVVVLLEK